MSEFYAKLLDEKRREIRALHDALIEATAELIYLRLYGKDGALWSANESKDVWREKARAAAALKFPADHLRTSDGEPAGLTSKQSK